MRARLLAIAALGWACQSPSCTPAWIRRDLDPPLTCSPELAVVVADYLRRVTCLEPKLFIPTEDPHEEALLLLGEDGVPCLIEHVDDVTPTEWGNFFMYKRGDMALDILHKLCPASSWPFPDDSEVLEDDYMSPGVYPEFMRRPGARTRLRVAWRRFYREGRCGVPFPRIDP